MQDTNEQKSSSDSRFTNILKRDTEKVLEVISKILMPILLLVLGTWFNYSMSSSQEKQRQLEQQQAEEQQRSALVESYIKHLTSTNPVERDLALHIISLDSAEFDVRLVNLVSAYAAVGTPEERLTALQALSHASHFKDPAVQAAAKRNISTVPTMQVTQADPVVDQQKAAIVNHVIQAANTANIQSGDISNALNKLHSLKLP